MGWSEPMKAHSVVQTLLLQLSLSRRLRVRAAGANEATTVTPCPPPPSTSMPYSFSFSRDFASLSCGYHGRNGGCQGRRRRAIRHLPAAGPILAIFIDAYESPGPSLTARRRRGDLGASSAAPNSPRQPTVRPRATGVCLALH